MKKNLLILSIFGSLVINAQMQKGALFLGASVNYFKSSNNNQPENLLFQKSNYSNSNFNSDLRLGYFITNKLVIGLLGRHANSNSSQENENPGSRSSSTSKSNINSFGLFARGYKLFNENKFGVFCQFEGTYSIGNSSAKTYNSWNSPQNVEQKGDITGYNMGIRPGLVYFVTNKIGIEGSLGGIFYSNNTEQSFENGSKISKNSYDGLNLSLGLNTIFLGINFYLGRK